MEKRRTVRGATSPRAPAPVEAAGKIFSDRRLKENIKIIGKTHDDQRIYRYNYKGDPRIHIGLMADEVEKKHPHAVGESPQLQDGRLRQGHRGCRPERLRVWRRAGYFSPAGRPGEDVRWPRRRRRPVYEGLRARSRRSTIAACCRLATCRPRQQSGLAQAKNMASTAKIVSGR